jgi:hypothetical protein
MSNSNNNGPLQIRNPNVGNARQNGRVNNAERLRDGPPNNNRPRNNARTIINEYTRNGRIIKHLKGTRGRGIGTEVTFVKNGNRRSEVVPGITKQNFRDALIRHKAEKLENKKNNINIYIEKSIRTIDRSNIQNKQIVLKIIKNLKQKTNERFRNRNTLVNHLTSKIPLRNGDYTYDPVKKIHEYIKKIKINYNNKIEPRPQLKTLIKSTKLPNPNQNIHPNNFEMKKINNNTKTFTFKYDREHTIKFFTNMYIDIWHDNDNFSIDNFKSVFNKFINVDDNDDVYFNKIRPNLPNFHRRLLEEHIKNELSNKISRINNSRKYKIETINSSSMGAIDQKYKLKKNRSNNKPSILVHLDSDKDGIIHNFTEKIFGSSRKYLIGLPKYYDAGMYMTPARMATNVLGIRNGVGTQLIFDLNGFNIKLKFTFDELPDKMSTIEVSRTIPTKNKPNTLGKTIHVSLNGNRIKPSTRGGPNVIGKFLGDFLQICKVIIDQRNNKNTIFATFDKSAMNSYIFMSNMKLGIPNRHQNRLINRTNETNNKCIFLEQIASQRNTYRTISYNLHLINMNDVIERLNRTPWNVARNKQTDINKRKKNINSFIEKFNTKLRNYFRNN